MDKELLEILSKQNELIKEQNEMLKDQIVTMRAGILTLGDELKLQTLYLSRACGESHHEKFVTKGNLNPDTYSELEGNYSHVHDNVKDIPV